MLTFIFLFAGIIIVGAGWLIANGANQRKRAGQSGEAKVKSQQAGGGAARTGRPTGVN